MSDTVFAETFDVGGLHHTRCEKPTGTLTPQRVHRTMDLPLDLGRATMDLYADHEGERAYTRLVHMPTGEVAWYLTEIQPASSEGNANG